MYFFIPLWFLILIAISPLIQIWFNSIAESIFAVKPKRKVQPKLPLLFPIYLLMRKYRGNAR
jgi:hypothetical protein